LCKTSTVTKEGVNNASIEKRRLMNELSCTMHGVFKSKKDEIQTINDEEQKKKISKEFWQHFPSFFSLIKFSILTVATRGMSS
jgi:hypothetical protein